jgi:hypothetical protein
MIASKKSNKSQLSSTGHFCRTNIATHRRIVQIKARSNETL